MIRSFSACGRKRRIRPKTRRSRPGVADYAYRYYDPVTGRWQSSDPIGEGGGSNLFAMLKNDAINSYDYLGLSDCESCNSALEKAKQRHADSLARMEKNGCKINLYCVCRKSGDSERAGGDFKGYKTWFKGTPTGGRIRVFCAMRDSPYSVYFDHEIVHAEQWCNGDTGSDCETVVKSEIEAACKTNCSAETNPIRKRSCVYSSAHSSCVQTGYCKPLDFGRLFKLHYESICK